MADTMNLVEGIQAEMNRCRELADEYRAIPTGQFGLAMILADIREGEAALASGDVIRMLKAYDALQNCE